MDKTGHSVYYEVPPTRTDSGTGVSSSTTGGMTDMTVAFDDTEFVAKSDDVTNSMTVSYESYKRLKSSGRVTGGDPMATAAPPAVYTDENGIKWALHVSSPSIVPRMPVVNNRHARRAAKAKARRRVK
jgi:hypothetical protein